MKFKWLVRVTQMIIAATAIFTCSLLHSTTYAATTTFSYSGPVVPIPDAADLAGNNPGAQVGAPISVSGLAGLVAGITISIDGTTCTNVAGATTVGIDHSFVSDLVITLRSPSATDVVVIDQVDSSGNNFCQVVLDDAAATSIQTVTSVQAPFTGTWAPNAPLSTFFGETANGTWTLLAQDFFQFDTGNIRAWSITITDNLAPTASNVIISGNAIVGNTLTGGYTYADGDGDLEDTSTFRWMSDTVNTGVTMTPIGGATALTYMPQSSDVGRYLFFCVTPVADTGISPGTEVCSAASEAVVGPSPVPTPATPVPTLSEWGIMIFMVLAGLGSVYYLRRRKRV